MTKTVDLMKLFHTVNIQSKYCQYMVIYGQYRVKQYDQYTVNMQSIFGHKVKVNWTRVSSSLVSREKSLTSREKSLKSLTSREKSVPSTRKFHPLSRPTNKMGRARPLLIKLLTLSKSETNLFTGMTL